MKQNFLWMALACKLALFWGLVHEWQSHLGIGVGGEDERAYYDLAIIFTSLRLGEGKYHWLKGDTLSVLTDSVSL